MKLIKESLNEFHKAGDPLRSLGVGTGDDDINRIIAKDILASRSSIQKEFDSITAKIILLMAELISEGSYIENAIVDSMGDFNWYDKYPEEKANKKYKTFLYILRNEYEYKFNYEEFIENL